MARLDRMTFGQDFAKQEPDDEEGNHEPDFEELKGCFCQGQSGKIHQVVTFAHSADVQLECTPCRIIRQCVRTAVSSSVGYNCHTFLAHHASVHF